MAWIESHQELARHPKTKKLARLLGVSLPTTIGHLHMFWWWAMDYAETGCISNFDAEDIADAVNWPPEDAQTFMSSLVESKFVVETEAGLCINDWHDYVGRLIDKKEQNRERKRKSRENAKGKTEGHADVTRTSQGQPNDSRESHRATIPNLTIPNHTKPKEKRAGGETTAPPTPQKVKYADYVTLTEEEHQKLIDQYGTDATSQMITVLDNYKGANGKKYKSDYRAILNWVVDRVKPLTLRGGNQDVTNPAGSTGHTAGRWSQFVR